MTFDEALEEFKDKVSEELNLLYLQREDSHAIMALAFAAFKSGWEAREDEIDKLSKALKESEEEKDRLYKWANRGG